MIKKRKEKKKMVIRLDISKGTEEQLREEYERISKKRVKKKKGEGRKKGSGVKKVKKEEKEAIII